MCCIHLSYLTDLYIEKSLKKKEEALRILLENVPSRLLPNQLYQSIAQG